MMETISQFLLTFLLNAAWQIPLITLIAFIGDRLLRQAPARIRHQLWFLTLIIVFALPAYSAFNSTSFIFMKPGDQSVIEQSLSLPTQSLLKIESDRSVWEMLPGRSGTVILISREFFIIFSALYFLFLVYQSIKLLYAWRQTQNIKRQAFLAEPSTSVLTVTEDCQRILGIKDIQILYSSSISSPLTIGYLKPIIILPKDLLQETDRNILSSAIGHEASHIKRHDYLLNLLCEFIYLPLSIHPVMRLVKRRVKETRELRCDEMVTDKLLKPTIYAKSLVQLAGAARNWGRPATMTIGINDADILEDRIISILKRPKLPVYRHILLLISVSLLFLASVTAAGSFTFNPVVSEQPSTLKADQMKEPTASAEIKLLKEEQMSEIVQQKFEAPKPMTEIDLKPTDHDSEETIKRKIARLSEQEPMTTNTEKIFDKIKAVAGKERR